MKAIKKYWILFSTVFLISASTNGGYAIVAVMKEKFVRKYHWIEEEEMLDLLSIGQSAPGPIAVNTSLLVGYRVAGYPGAFITLLGVILPPLLIMSLLTIFYNRMIASPAVRVFLKGMQAGVAALLVNVTIDLFTNIAKKHDKLFYLLMLLAFLYARFLDFSTLYLALFMAIAGLLKMRFLSKEIRP